MMFVTNLYNEDTMWICYAQKPNMWHTAFLQVSHLLCLTDTRVSSLLPVLMMCKYLQCVPYMYSSTDRLLLSFHHSIYMYDSARLKKQPGKKCAEIPIVHILNVVNIHVYVAHVLPGEVVNLHLS